VCEESGIYDTPSVLGIAGSHDNAVDLAETCAQDVERRHGIGMFPVGHNGRWKARDYQAGEGTKFEIWVEHGPAEQDYDTARGQQP